jgi:glycosyltransferase involved in cell wall biosynthesis
MKFSIITCTKNSAKYLAENIASVKAQSLADYEQVFIDGFSTDGTAEMIKEYQAEFPDRVSFYQLPPKGISAAMNAGTARAKGEFVIHLHADDRFHDGEVLREVNDFLNQHQELDWIYGLANVIEEDGASVMVWPNKPWLHFHNYRSAWGRWLVKMITFIPHQAVFIKKEILDKFGGFDETITSRMDPDLWMRLSDKTKWSFFKRVICDYRVRPGAQSSSLANLKQNMDNLLAVQKRYLTPPELLLARMLNQIRTWRNKTLR